MIDIENYKMNTIDDAIKDIKNGKMLIVMDDEDRENEGDLVCSAELCTPEIVNFMSSNGKGLICTPISNAIAARLELELMVNNNTSLHTTGFTVSVDYLHDTTTGISAADRAKTINAIAADNTKPEDLGRPGHIFPLIAVDGGVLKRAGHTEAVIDLMKIANLKEAGVLCEIINENGTMARKSDLIQFARTNNLKIITVKDLIAYRLERESLVKCVAMAKLPTPYGDFTILGFENSVDSLEHIALVKGDLDKHGRFIRGSNEKFEKINEKQKKSYQKQKKSYQKLKSLYQKLKSLYQKLKNYNELTENFNEKLEYFNEQLEYFNEFTENFSEQLEYFNEFTENFSEQLEYFSEFTENFNEKLEYFNEKLENFNKKLEYYNEKKEISNERIKFSIEINKCFIVTNKNFIETNKNFIERLKEIYEKLKSSEPILVRVHSECLTGDVFNSLRCDCGNQLHQAMEMINKAGRGVLVYMRQEGRGIGLLNKVKTYALQDSGLDTVDANVELGFAPDSRNYGIGAQILRHIGVNKMRLMTNNPTKRVGLESYGLEVVELVNIEQQPNEHNHFYLSTKKNKMGHILERV